MKSDNSIAGIKKILCPTDFSAESQKAIEYAARLAASYKAVLYVFHSANRRESVSPAKFEKLEQAISVIACKAVGRDQTLQLKTFIAENSKDPGQCITTFAGENSIDLIVMKSHYHPVSAHLFGSTIQSTVQNTDCPVLLLPFDWKNAEQKFRRILINYDFSRAADKLLVYAKNFAGKFDSEIHLLQIISPSETMRVELSHSAAGEKIARGLMRRRLQKVTLDDMRDGYRARCAIFYGKTPQAVLNYAEEKKIDLICAATPEQKFRFESLFPTWLERVLRGAHCPVVVLPSTIKQPALGFYSPESTDFVYAA